MSTDLELILPAITPALPLVLADRKFLTTLATVETQVAALRVTDAATQQLAADLQIRLTTAGGALEKERKAIKQPFLDKCTEIDAAARPVTLRIDTAKAVIKKALTDFALEQARIAAKAEADRQAELRRLEQLRLAEERARQEKAAALAKQAALAQAERERVAEAARIAGMPAPVVLMDVEDDCPDDAPAPKTETERQLRPSSMRRLWWWLSLSESRCGRGSCCASWTWPRCRRCSAPASSTRPRSGPRIAPSLRRASQFP